MTDTGRLIEAIKKADVRPLILEMIRVKPQEGMTRKQLVNVFKGQINIARICLEKGQKQLLTKIQATDNELVRDALELQYRGYSRLNGELKRSHNDLSSGAC